MFIFSGFVKAVDPLGFTYKIMDYLTAFGLPWVPQWAALMAAVVLASAEFVLGVFMLFGIRRKIATTLIILFMSAMTPLTLYLAIANPVADCGCFGDALVLTNWQTFWKNVILLASAVVVFVGRQRIIHFVSVTSEWLISLYTALFILALSLYCLARLPIFDFRPYKIGNNILREMSIPPGAEPSVLETVFILQKNGKKQEFTLDNYPDSTWTFSEARTIVRKQGYEPAIKDFFMLNLETGEDITMPVLQDAGYNFLLVAHRIEEADDSNIDLLNEIYDYSTEHGYGFYALTSSPDAEIEMWREKTGAEYPFCLMDDVTLKTIIRANPGLLLIKGGTIINKWNSTNLPDEYELTGPLEQISLGIQPQSSNFGTLAAVFGWFALPLMLVLALDLFIIRRRHR